MAWQTWQAWQVELNCQTELAEPNLSNCDLISPSKTGPDLPWKGTLAPPELLAIMT